MKIHKWDENDDLGILINHQIADCSHEEQLLWNDIFSLAGKAVQGRPSKRYLTKADALIEALGKHEFTNRLQNWIEFATHLKNSKIPVAYDFDHEHHVYETLSYLSRPNIIYFKGLIWMVSLLDVQLLPKIRDLAMRAYKKIPRQGPSSAAIGNACLYVLGSVDTVNSLSYLMQIQGSKLNNKAKQVVQNYLQKASERLEVPISELKEMSVPDFGLENGSATYEFGDYTLKLEIKGIGKSKLTWYKPDGTIQKTAPSFVQKDLAYSEQWVQIKLINSQVKKQLTLQRNILDRGYIQDRKWNYAHFEQYFLNHGLVSFLTKRLIWRFQNGAQSAHAIYRFGQWVDLHGDEVEWINDDTTVELWHPVADTIENVLAWRNYLMDNEILQPLKQAFREKYVLTDAERNTKSYSNRMAAHILKQRQFSALTRVRNWKYTILGEFSYQGEGLTKIDIPSYNMTAEFWVNELEDDSDEWVWQYITTDQVRFTNKTNQTIDLQWVPEIVFSEIMRDIDLFVGVCSVGNDPQWADNNGKPQIREYWRSYSFGDLSEMAKTRKSVLQRLVPRLKIRDVAELAGNFLIVKGKKRVYKIHIGSGNILMEPNDQYLCIVPDKKSNAQSNKLFLPFEGDKGLSIILSKAFLLAEDDKITDKTILSQIG